MKKEIESKLSFSDRISSHVKVKVTKKEPDAMNSLCGSPVKTDENGNEYFIIPEHQASYIGQVFPKYTVSKGFLPPDALANLNAESEANKQSVGYIRQEGEKDEDEEGEVSTLPEGTVISQELPSKPKARGNPNWRKKHATHEAVESGTGHQLTGV